MLEALVPSRIRRTLLEYLVTHPRDRFYLRGLAKGLGLSVSPLRRELKRLEQTGVLRAFQEGNMLFYTVDAASPVFQQLKQAGQPAPALIPVGPGSPQPPSAPLARQAGTAQSPQVIPIGIVSANSVARAWRGPLRGPALVGIATAGMALMLLMAGFFYLTMTNEHLASAVKRALTARPANVTVVAPPASNSGVMRSSRWQIVPGGFGGFSSGTGEESY